MPVTRTAPARHPAIAPARIEASKPLLILAFAGSGLIFATAVVVSLYTQNLLNAAVQRTTTQALPELLAALRLSERNALLAAATPTLSTARDLDELAEIRTRLDGLLADVDSQLTLLDREEPEQTIKQVRRSAGVIRSSIGKLKAANELRIRLAAQQRDALNRIQRIHSELMDTISPVFYGVSSLNNLFARRAQRSQGQRLRELRDQLYPRVFALLELKSLASAERLTEESRVELRQRVTSLRDLISDESSAELSSATAALVSSAPPLATLLRSYRDYLSAEIETAKAQLEAGFDNATDQEEGSTLALVEATTRDLSIASDIRAEGNLLLALLSAVVDVNHLDALAGLQTRFNASLSTFQGAAEAFDDSPLAQRNPVLAGAVRNIATNVVEFAESSTNPFALRRRELELRADILQLLSTHREVATQLTQYTQQMVARRQGDTDSVAQRVEATRQASQQVLIAVSIGGLGLMALIAFTTIKMLVRRERMVRGAQEATLSANQVLDAVGYTARALLGSEFWEQVIDSVLARLCGAIDASRMAIYRHVCGEDGSCHGRLAHLWPTATDSPTSAPKRIDYHAQGLAGWVECLRRGETLSRTREQLPEDERGILEAFGSGAVLVVPIRINERLWGCLMACDSKGDRTWLSQDHEALVAAADTLGSAISRDRAAQDLRQAAIVFESTHEGVLITDAAGTIVAANPAFTESSGYSADEVIGQNPRILKSELQPINLAQGMWAALSKTGSWQGEVCNRRKDGNSYTEWLRINGVRDTTGKVSHFVGVYSDVAAIKETQARIHHLAHHDPLTDLPNRMLLSDRLGHAIERARRDNYRVAVLFLDLDRFKSINDTLGHGVGDTVLREVAVRLQRRVRAEDTVARLGGDEFMIVIDHLRHLEEAGLVAQKALDALAEEIKVDERQFYLTGSIGISLFPDDGSNVDELIKNADTAMYRAKERGRNGLHYYTSALSTDALEHFELENSLRLALERNEFELHYQPQRELASGRLVGVEALLRWRHPDHGIIPPDRFIPVAEDVGLMVPIGTWVLRTACHQARLWVDAGLPPLKMAVNLSGSQITREDLPDLVARALQDSRLDPECLELEITESFVMHQPERAIATLERLREMGLSLAIDDFGTGHSSLSHLKRIPSHVLKIDRSFVRDMPSDPNDEVIARAIIAMGHALSLKVVAEGIENTAQAEALEDAGCDGGQGYLFGRPLPVREAYALLSSELLASTSGAMRG